MMLRLLPHMAFAPFLRAGLPCESDGLADASCDTMFAAPLPVLLFLLLLVELLICLV